MYNRHRPSFTNRRTTSSLPRGTKRKLFAAVVGLLLLVFTIVYTIYLRLELNRLNNPEPATVVRYLAPDRVLATPAPRATMPPLPTPNLLWRTPNSTDITNVGATAVLGDKFFFIVYKEGTSELWWMAANRERATFVFNFREEYSSIELVPFEASQELLVRIGRDTEQVRVWRVDGQTLNVIEEPAVLRSPPLPLGQFDLSGRFLSPGHGHLYATRGDGAAMESLGLLLEDWGAASYLLFGEQFLFSGSQDGLNFELWQTDGRVAGTSQLKEINGTTETLDGRGSHPAHFIQVGEQVYFLARADQTAVPDLWVTDGTSANTYPLTQQLFGQRQLLTTTAGRPLFFPAGEKLFFVAEKQVEDDERASGELWVTDGRPEGTVLLLEQLSTQLDFTYRAAVLEGTLYFLRHGTRELWRSDGTAEGTKLVLAFDEGLRPGWLVTLNDKLYLTVTDTRAEKNVALLWESDGTAEGSYGLLSTADAGWFTIGPLVAFHDSLLFSTFELENGVAVWVVTPHTGEVRRVLANPLRLNR